MAGTSRGGCGENEKRRGDPVTRRREQALESINIGCFSDYSGRRRRGPIRGVRYIRAAGTTARAAMSSMVRNWRDIGRESGKWAGFQVYFKRESEQLDLIG